ERRHAVGTHHHVLRQLHRDHVARLHVQDVAQFQLTARHRGSQRYADVENVFAQGLDPALVLIIDIGLEAGIEHLADRLDHRVRHGDVQVAAATIQLDMEGRHHDHFAGADDIGQRRIDLGVDVLEIDVHHRMPGLAQVDKGLVEHHAHHTQLGGGELAAFDLGMATVTAKEVVHQFEHQLGVKDEQPGTAQGFHLHQV